MAPASDGTNASAPVPSTATVKVAPSREVSIVNCRVVAEAPSPHVAPGSAPNEVMSTGRGRAMVALGAWPVRWLAASGVGYFALDGLYGDQPAAWDWLMIASGPQPEPAPVASVSAAIAPPPAAAAQLRTQRRVERRGLGRGDGDVLDDPAGHSPPPLLTNTFR